MKHFLHRYRTAFALVFCLATASVTLSFFYTVHINVTDSLPYKLFIVDKTNRAVKPQGLYAFRWTGGYGYDQGSVFIKIAGGVAGDQIHVKDQVVYLNGQPVVRALTHTPKKQTPLAPAANQTIPVGGVFFYTPVRDGFDGRYEAFGLTSTKTVIGKAYGFF